MVFCNAVELRIHLFMLFNTLSFILAIPSVLLLYWVAVHIIGCKAPAADGADNKVNISNLLSVALLVGISYAFFIYEQPAGALVLFAITVLTYVFGLVFDRLNQRHAQKQLRHQLAVSCAAALVIAPLAIFKYTAFISDLFGYQAGTSVVRQWIIPLGISFFTFQAIGYVWDVYRGKLRAERNFLYYTLFVGFFPQIASGPISKAQDLLPQIRRPRRFSADNVAYGIRVLIWGYFLKAVFADRMATAVDPVFGDYENFSGMSCLLASFFYSLQIYGDFAGYSLMALGVGRMFGFSLINNFRQPYLATSISEFWHRWHISLSTWLKDNVYLPLGGSRCSKPRSYGNILATFTVSGIWHGANLTFIFWGFMHGIIQCVEKFFGLGGKPANRWIVPLRVAVTFLVANFAWIFFRAPSIGTAIGIIKRIFTLAPGVALPLSKTDIVFFTLSALIVVLVDFAAEHFPRLRLLHSSRQWIRLSVVLALIFMILMMGVLDSSSFIYVNF